MQSPSDVKGVKQADNLADIPIQTKGQYVTNNATDLSTLPQVIRARTRKLSVHFNCFFSLTSSGFNWKNVNWKGEKVLTCPFILLNIQYRIHYIS